ncbi:MAG TPA: LamG domain-containing protein [Steroidobacteraceae bacterium]|nr:LamG domain-containing protein [Steroidobacteraceae bacterium]
MVYLNSLQRITRILSGLVLSVALAACASAKPPSSAAPTVWALRDVARIGGLATEVVGAPKPAGPGAESAIVFDGKADGVLVPVNPIAGWSAFTIEVRFKPDGTGGEEQRFLHLEDSLKHRVLMETRVTPDKQWSLDTFLFQDAGHRLTLLDRARLHPTDRWYWVALVYDGKTMAHYVNGALELEGEVAFTPMSAGRTSIGVRQNLVSWFKGAIGEVRFTPDALPAASLKTEGDSALRR